MFSFQGIIFFLVIISFSCADKFFYLPSPNAKLVYKYQVEVKTGILKPSFASEFILDTDLHISIFPESDGEKILIDFKNQKIQLSNKDVSLERKQYDHGRFIPVPEEANKFFTPFIIEYGNSGNSVKQIFTQIKEPLWISNIKKNIASVLQFDWSKFNFLKRSSKPFIYEAEETTLYGQCTVKFIGMPTMKGYEIQKKFNPTQSCSHFNGDLFSTIEFSGAKGIEDNYSTFENSRLYNLVKMEGDQFVIDKIVTKQQILFLPFKHVGHSFYVKTNQTFIYQQSLTSTNSSIADNGVDFTTPQSLIFTNINIDANGKYPDFSLGRTTTTMKNEMNKLYSHLLQATQQLGDAGNKDPHNPRAIGESVAILKKFELKDYEHFSEKLESDKDINDLQVLDFFYKMVPNIGSGASALFVKNLVESYKLNDTLAIGMLTALGINLRITSPALIAALDELIQVGVLKPDVRRAALLAFSNILYKTFKNDPSSDDLTNYINQFEKLLKNSSTYKDQLLYIQILGNIKVGNVFAYLIPIAKGDQILRVPYDVKLQMHAIWSLERVLSDTDTNLLYNTLMTVLLDKKLRSEVRIVALQVILNNSNAAELMDIFWLMQAETDHNVYNYYYTYVQSYSKLEQNGQKSAFKDMAGLMKKLAKNREVAMSTTAFAYESIDVEIGMGTFLKGQIVVDKERGFFLHLHVDLFVYVFNQPLKLYSVYFKMNGLDKVYDAQKLDRSLLDMKLNSELIISMGGKVIYSRISDMKVIDTILDESTLLPLNYFHQSIFFEMQADYNFPSDLGTMVQLYFEAPQIRQLDLRLNISESGELVKIFTNNKFWRHESFGIKTFNPFTSAWHGVRQEPTFDLNIPLNFKIEMIRNRYDAWLPKLAFNLLDQNVTSSEISFRSYVDTKVIVDQETEKNYLSMSSKKNYVEVEKVSKGKTSVKNYNIFHGFLNDLGLQYDLSVFDCEPHPGGKYKTNPIDLLMVKPFSDFFKISLFDFSLRLFSFLKTNFYVPQMVSCGIRGSLKQSSVNVVNERHAELFFDGELDRFSIDFKNNNNYSIAQYVLKLDVLEYEQGVRIGFYRLAENGTSTSLCLEHFDEKHPIKRARATMKFFAYLGHYHGSTEQCVKDGVKFKIETISEYSDDQLKYSNDKYLTYSECLSNSEYMIVPFSVNSRCAIASRLFRSYKVLINYENLPSKWRKNMNILWNWLHTTYPAITKYNIKQYVGPNQLCIDINFPMHSEDYFDTTIIFPNHEASFFENIDYNNWIWSRIPDQTNVDSIFALLKRTGYVKSCTVVAKADEIIPHLNRYPNRQEWTAFMTVGDDGGNENVTLQLTIYLKRINNDQMAMKLTWSNKTFVIQPDLVQDRYAGNSKFKITMDDFLLDGLITDRGKLNMFTIGDNFFITPFLGDVVVTFNGYQAIFEVSRFSKSGGLCFQENKNIH